MRLNLVYSFLNSLCRTLVRFALAFSYPLHNNLPKSSHPLFKSRSSFYRLYTCQPQNCDWFCMWTVFLFL